MCKSAKIPFHHKPSRFYTWVSPKFNEQNIIINQIDFILINERLKNLIKHVYICPVADANSNPNPIIVKIKIKIRKAPKSIETEASSPKTDKSVKEKLAKRTNGNLKKVPTDKHEHNINHTWSHITDTIKTSQSGQRSLQK